MVDFHFWENQSIKEESYWYVLFQNNVRLGTGIIRNLSYAIDLSVQENFLLETIDNMGFKKEEIRKLHPSSEDLSEICSEIKKFGFSIKYQELLEEKIKGSKVHAGLIFRK